jgi:hypothetical protein
VNPKFPQFTLEIYQMMGISKPTLHSYMQDEAWLGQFLGRVSHLRIVS